MEYSFSLFFPVEKRETARGIIMEIETRVGGFVRGQLLLALAVGALALVAYLCIGLPSVISLAFLAGVFELVPLFGPALGALPAFLVTFASDPAKLVWVILAVFIIQLLENHFLAPRVMQKTVGVNPILTILSITGFGVLLGFPGLLMAIPLAAVFQVILDRSFLRPVESKIEPPTSRDRVSQLSYEVQELVQDVHELIRVKESIPADGDNDEIEDPSRRLHPIWMISWLNLSKRMRMIAMKQVAWYTAVSLATISAVFLLWQFRTAILLFILS